MMLAFRNVWWWYLTGSGKAYLLTARVGGKLVIRVVQGLHWLQCRAQLRGAMQTSPD